MKLFICRQNNIRSKLKSKLKNVRFRNPELQAKKFKVSKAALERVGLPNYDCPQPPTDEEQSSAYQLKNTVVEEDQAEDLKSKTLGMRRYLLTRARDPLPQIKHRFPWLFCEEEVSFT